MSDKRKNSKNSESNPQNEESPDQSKNDKDIDDEDNDDQNKENNDDQNNDYEINDSQENAENEEENEINSKDENNDDVEDNNYDQQSSKNEENENDHYNEEDNYENIEDDYHKESKRSMNPSEKIDYTTVKPMYKGNKESVDNLDKSSLNHNIDEKNPIEEENNEEYNRQQQQSNDDAHTENEAVKADFENHQMNKDVSSSEEMINLSLNKPFNNGLTKVITNKEPKELTALEYDNLIEWLSELKFEKPLNFNYLARDFSDGIKYMTILKIYFPKFVDNHNYIPTLNKKQKIINWETVSSKVLRKLGLELRKIQIERIVAMESGYIEKHLFNLKDRVRLLILLDIK